MAQNCGVRKQEYVYLAEYLSFTDCEVEALLDGLETVPDLVASFTERNLTDINSEEVCLDWQTVTNHVNAKSTIIREPQEIKRTWLALRYYVKRKVDIMLKCDAKPFDEIFNVLPWLDRRVIILMKDPLFISLLNSSNLTCPAKTSDSPLNTWWDGSQSPEHISIEPMLNLQSPGSLQAEEELGQVEVKLEPTSPPPRTPPVESSVLTTALHPQEISSVTVSELQQLKFSQLSLHEKIQVKKRGRSTPDLLISQPGISNNKKYIRSFNSECYQRKSWLCGCEVQNALFCFPCLLFGGEVTWTKNGFRNINKMKEKTEKHEKSKKHVDNVVSLSLLGTISIKEKLSETYRLSINEHNIKVKKNRDILSKIIDCIFFCGNFETPLCGHDEEDDSVNPGVFRGLVNFASKLDSDLKNHLETSAVFKDVSKTIQNELLDCLLQIYHEEIRTEIRNASFVAIMADDTTDVSEHTQMVLVLRYVLNGEIFERFCGFFIPENQTADGISNSILEQLNIILQGNGQKLIAQTFDGANVMKGKKAEVQEKIKAVYSNAHFIHGYADQLNLIMRNAASVTRNARIFFSYILAIKTFFSRSPQRVSILRKHVEASISRPSSTRWNFNIWTINRVHENVQPLKNCLTEIQSTSNADQTIAEATGILKYLNDDNFKFWLELFHQIMPHVEIIYNQMHSQEMSVFKVNECIANFKSAILELRNSKYCENPSKTLMAEAKEVCDCICVDIMDRYSSTKHLVAAKLFNKKCFSSFKNEHPSKEIALTIEAYPMIDKQKLETELKVFYCRSDIHDYRKLIELLKFILENNLDDVFSEITKLIQILLTLPMTTSEADRCFSTLKRIKTFLRNTMNSERINALAVLSMENNFLSCHPEMKEKIIDLFAQIKTRKMDFNFK